MKSFLIRAVSIAAIVGVVLGYNNVVEARDAEEAKLKAEYNAAMAELNASNYTDGTYTGEAQGFGGIVRMEVVIEDGQITEVNVLSAEDEDYAYFTMAEDIIPEIIDTQSADVDTISGATFSSTGIRDAVEIALEEASK